jgi:hypothetical protein
MWIFCGSVRCWEPAAPLGYGLRATMRPTWDFVEGDAGTDAQVQHAPDTTTLALTAYCAVGDEVSRSPHEDSGGWSSGTGWKMMVGVGAAMSLARLRQEAGGRG